jgi:hypothetical protein
MPKVSGAGDLPAVGCSAAEAMQVDATSSNARHADAARDRRSDVRKMRPIR